MSNRLRAGIVSFMVASLALVGCAGSGSDTSGGEESENSAEGTLYDLPDDEQVEITFESYNLASAGATADTINGLIETFMEENPNITVVGQPAILDADNNSAGSVQRQLLAGDAPEVAQLTFSDLDFAATELGSQNLSSLVGTDGLEEAFGGEYPYHPRAKVLADWNGSTYGMPYVFSTPLLWINESYFEEAGLDVASTDLSTWDAVQTASETILEKTGKPAMANTCIVKGGNWCMQGTFLSNGAQVLSDDRSTIEFGSQAAIDTVNVFRDMNETGTLVNTDVATMYDDFAKGKTPMIVTTAALAGMFSAGAEADGWTLSNRTMPAFGDQEIKPTNSGSYLAMFTDDPAKQAAAWKFMQFMTSPTAYEQISTKIGYLPLRNGMVEEGGPLYEWVEADPLLKPNLEQLDVLEPWVSYPGDSYVEVDDLLSTAIEESIFNDGDAATLMPEAAARAQELIEE